MNPSGERGSPLNYAFVQQSSAAVPDRVLMFMRKVRKEALIGHCPFCHSIQNTKQRCT